MSAAEQGRYCVSAKRIFEYFGIKDVKGAING